MWRIWWAPNNASRWQMGFNSAFKGLKVTPLLTRSFLMSIKTHRISLRRCKLKVGMKRKDVYFGTQPKLRNTLQGWILCFKLQERWYIHLSDAMEQFPYWEAVSFPPYITGSDYSPLRPQDPPFVPILSQMSPIQASTPYSSKTHVTIIPHIDLCSPTGFFHWGLSIKTVHAFLYSPIHATWPSDLNLFSSYHRTHKIYFVTSRNREALQYPVCSSGMLFPSS